MAGLLPADVVAALGSLRQSYIHEQRSLDGRPGAHASAELRHLDRLIATIERAMATGDAPVANLTAALRSSGKFLSHPIARLSRGDTVKLLGIGGKVAGGPNRGWWRVESRSGVSGWIERRALFPDSVGAVSSAPGTSGPGVQPDEIELGVRDTMVR